MMNWRKIFHFFVLAAVLTEIVEPSTPFVRIFIEDGHKYSKENALIQDARSHPQTKWLQEELRENDVRSKGFQLELVSAGSNENDFDEDINNHHCATPLQGAYPLGPPLFSRHVDCLFRMQTYEFS